MPAPEHRVLPSQRDQAAYEVAQRLVREPELRRLLAINSRRAYEKHFTLDRFAKDFVALIDKADLAEAGNVRADVMTEALSSR